MNSLGGMEIDRILLAAIMPISFKNNREKDHAIINDH